MSKAFSCPLLFCFIVLLQLSCAPKLYVETSRPAEVSVDRQQSKVIVINRYKPRLVISKRVEPTDIVTQGAHQAFMGAIQAVLNDSTYQLIHTDVSNYRPQEINQKLTKEMVREISRQHPYDLLLSLEDFKIFGSQQSAKTVKKNDISLGETGFSRTSKVTIFAQSNWVLYDSSGTVLDEVSILADDLYQINTNGKLQSTGVSINTLAWDTGYDYWKRLSPTPISYVRPYYARKSLKQAAACMAAEDWYTAISLLEPIATGENRQASKAAYNLAVIYEVLGWIEESKYWARKAIKQNDMPAFQLLLELDGY